MNDYDFEMAFLGDRQATIVHKYHLSDDRWHICTVDSNDWYQSGYYRLERDTMTFLRMDRRDDGAHHQVSK